jgi:glucokinase
MTKETKSGDCGILAIDAGGTYFKSVLFDAHRSPVANSFYQIAIEQKNKEDDIVAAYAMIIRRALSFAATSGITINGIGISTPGPFDYQRGIYLMKHKFTSLYGVNLVDAIIKIMPEISDVKIRFRHDANSFLAGEMWTGAAQGLTRAGGVTLGTGIGVACCIDNKFLTNELGSPAPEVSVWNKPYHNGICEDYVASRALVKKYLEKYPDYVVANGAKGIAEAAKQGDNDAVEIYNELGIDLGNILLPWCERFQPQAIIFGGQISKDFELFSLSLHQFLNQIANPPKLAASQLGEKAALYGVVSLF